jgi:hypothetical protein
MRKHFMAIQCHDKKSGAFGDFIQDGTFNALSPIFLWFSGTIPLDG